MVNKVKVTANMQPLVDGLKNAREPVLEQIGEEGRQLFKKWVDPWHHVAPIFVIVAGNQAEISIEDLIAFWVNFGTSVRWRLMSQDFTPKTKVGSLNSGPGSGRATGFSKVPLPGIDPRRADLEVEKELEKIAAQVAASVYASVL